jgi:SAM-dependent methyltransferase
MRGGEVGVFRVNLGCGSEPESGFLSVDRVLGCGADLAFDLEDCARGTPLPFADGTVDVVLASHVLEHITGLVPLMREIHRALKPGGHLCVVSPYVSSDDAWEDPTHVRAFTELSFHYFNEKLYSKPGHAGHYPSEIDFTLNVVSTTLVPFADLVDPLSPNRIGSQAEMAIKKRFMRNIIKEMQVVLSKPKPVDSPDGWSEGSPSAQH